MIAVTKFYRRYFHWAVLVGLMFNLWLWLYTYWQLQPAPDLVPLHYTIYFGVDLLDVQAKLYLYPAFGLIILIVNSVLAWFFKKEQLLHYFLTSSMIAGQILIFLTELALAYNYF